MLRKIDLDINLKLLIKLGEADDLLANERFEECIEACNEVEKATKSPQANSLENEPEQILERLAQIRRTLNSKMIGKVRQHTNSTCKRDK